MKKFRDAGGKPGDPSNPARKWASVFWEYGRQHPKTPAGHRGTVAALSLLMSAEEFDESIAKIEALPLDDLAWQQAIYILAQAADKKGAPQYFTNKVSSILQQSQDPNLRANVWMALGHAYLKKQRLEEARRAFEAVIYENPRSRLARGARGDIYELTRLRVGQLSPGFKGKTTDGKHVSLENFRGNVVLLNFWATW